MYIYTCATRVGKKFTGALNYSDAGAPPAAVRFCGFRHQSEKTRERVFLSAASCGSRFGPRCLGARSAYGTRVFHFVGELFGIFRVWKVLVLFFFFFFKQ